MDKNKIKKLILIIFTLFLFSCNIEDDKSSVNTLFNNNWSIEQTENNISFSDDGMFTINDSIYGSYEEINDSSLVWAFDGNADTMIYKFIDNNQVSVKKLPIFGNVKIYKK